MKRKSRQVCPLRVLSALGGLSPALLLPSEAAVQVSITDVAGRAGEQVVAWVQVDQAAGLAGGEMTLSLPEFARAGRPEPASPTSGFLVASRAKVGQLDVAMAAAQGLSEESAVVLAVPVTIARDAPPGTYAVSFERLNLYHEGAGILDSSPVPGSLTVVPPPPDQDGDSLPDDWELSHFAGLSQSADADPDQDGYSNYEESLVGSDPTSAESAFRISAMELLIGTGQSSVLLEWKGRAGLEYEIYWSDGPWDPDMAWRQVYNPRLEISGERVRWVDDGTRTHSTPDRAPLRYYQILAR